MCHNARQYMHHHCRQSSSITVYAAFLASSPLAITSNELTIDRTTAPRLLRHRGSSSGPHNPAYPHSHNRQPSRSVLSSLAVRCNRGPLSNWHSQPPRVALRLHRLLAPARARVNPARNTCPRASSTRCRPSSSTFTHSFLEINRGSTAAQILDTALLLAPTNIIHSRIHTILA